MAPPRSGLAQEYLDCVLATLDYLGFPVSWNKIEDPSTRITFLGILFELRLPDTKLVRLVALGMENQEVVHKEGSGVLTWTFISCSISGKTRAYFPSEAVRSPAWYEGTASLHTSFCRGTGRLGMVVVLSAELEWLLILSPGHSWTLRSFRCIGYLWLRGFPRPVQVFHVSVAPTVAWGRYFSKGDGANCDGSCLVRSWSGKHFVFIQITWQW